MARTFQPLVLPYNLKIGHVLRVTTTTGKSLVYRVIKEVTVANLTSPPDATTEWVQFLPAESSVSLDSLNGTFNVVATIEKYTPVTLSDKFMWFVDFTTGKLNEIVAKVNSLTGRVTAVETLAASKASIDDVALTSTTTTLSASKIAALNATVLSDANSFATNAANEAKAAAISQLSGVDGTQLQALSDLQAALQANSNADGVIASDLLNKVDYSKSQTLTDAQAAQARSNIKFDTAVNAALLATVGDITTFDPDAILATALTLN